MSGLVKVPVSWPIVGGISTKQAPIMLGPPSHLVLDNVRQERLNEWRSRGGNTQSSLDDLPNANVPVIATETPWGGLVGLCRQTDAAPAGRVYNRTSVPRWHTPLATYLPNGGGLVQTCSQTTPGIWSRQAISPTLGVPAACSSAEGGGYRLSAWWSDVANNGIQMSLTTTEGAALISDSQFGNFPTAIRPKCVYSSAAGMLCMIYGFSVAGVVQVVRYSTTTGAQVAAPTTLTANGFVGKAMYLDAIYYGGATITVAFRDNVGTGALRIVEYNPAADTFIEYTPGENCANALSLLPDPDVSGIRMVGVGTNVPAVRIVRCNAVGVIQTNQVAEAVQTANIAGVAYEAGVGWMVVYDAGIAGVKTIRGVKFRTGVISAAKTIAAETAVWQGALSLVTNAWREPGTDSMHYIVQVQDADTTQPTFLELALEFENGAATISNQWTEPQARLIPLNAGAYGMAPPGGAVTSNLGQVQRTGTDRFSMTLPRITSFDIPGDLLGGAAPVYYRFAIDAWTVQYMNATTYTGQNQGSGCQTQQCAYLPVGSLLQTATGQLLCSHGASAKPFLPRQTAIVGAGALTLNKRYSHFVTTEFTDEVGNAWASDPSEASTTTLAGGQNTIQVVATLTPFENTARQRTVKFWRTQGDGSVYFLVHEVTGTIAATITITFVDGVPDTSLSQAFTAELQGTITPAFSHVVEWNRRLWGIERDFPTRVRFSKPIQAGASPMFPAGFVLDTDDGMGGCTGLAAMDDRVVLFKGRATYVAGGDGPDNTGVGTYPVFTRISSETGNIVGGPFLSTGAEVYMTSSGGVYRLKRSQEIDFVGSAIDLYLSMPLLKSPETVTGMFLSPGKNEVRIQTTHYRFVHDRVFNLWLRDTGGFASTPIAMTKSLAGAIQCFFTTSGHMWIEATDSTTPADAGVGYNGVIRSPWIRPANVGGWIRLYRARAEGTVTASSTVGLSALDIFFDDNEAIFETFFPVASTLTAGLLRIEARPQRQKCSSFSLQLTLPAGDATVRLEEWWTIVAAKTGAPPPYPSTRWSPTGIAPPPGPLYWFEADGGVTVDAGTGRVTEYDDRASHHWNMLAQNAFGAPLPGPRFDLNIQNGLPGLYYSDTGPGTAVGVTNHFSIPADVPLPSDDPVTVLAVVRRDNSYGGIVVTHRMTDISHQFGLWNNGGGLDITAMVTSSPSFILDDQNTHIGETLLVSWTWYGSGAATQLEVRINGVLKSGHWNSAPLAAGGASGFALGNVPSQGASRGFSGWECAVMAYLGTDALTRNAATQYLSRKYGVPL